MQAYLQIGSLLERLGVIFSGALVASLPVATVLIVLQPL